MNRLPRVFRAFELKALEAGGVFVDAREIKRKGPVRKGLKVCFTE